jgi:hypothetical protein
VLFDFEYKWEVYTPLAQRKYGYYALPVLWGDALAARIDMKLDRTSNTLVVCGFWPEERRMAGDPEFADALAKGIARLMRFLSAARLDAGAVEPHPLRKLFVQSMLVPRAPGDVPTSRQLRPSSERGYRARVSISNIDD